MPPPKPPAGGPRPPAGGPPCPACLRHSLASWTWAAAAGRPHVVPEDVAELAHPVLRHRLILDGEATFRGVEVDQVIDDLVQRVPAPSLRA